MRRAAFMLAGRPRSRSSSTRIGGPGGVVIGGDYQGLGIVRSLGRRGIPTCIIDDELSIGPFSRYATHAVRVPDLRDEDRCVQLLLEVGRRLGLDGWVLYPTREETVAAIARRRAELTERFRVPTPPWETTRWAWDKRATYEAAARLGIPTPRTWVVDDPSDVAALPSDMQFPLVVKPAIKEHFVYATGAKAWSADTLDDLVDRVATAGRIVGPGEVLVQERIPGDGRHRFAYCALFKDGRVLAGLTARRARQHPPDFGRASTFVETVDVPELEAPSIRFLQDIDYYGLVELEYMRDVRDDTYKLLDVNARTWGYHTLGAAAGVDFAWLLFVDQTDAPAPPDVRARTGVRWIRLATDIPTAALETAAGRLTPRGYLRSLRGVDTEAVFSRDDPLPGIAELGLIPYLVAKRGF